VMTANPLSAQHAPRSAAPLVACVRGLRLGRRSTDGTRRWNSTSRLMPAGLTSRQFRPSLTLTSYTCNPLGLHTSPECEPCSKVRRSPVSTPLDGLNQNYRG